MADSGQFAARELHLTVGQVRCAGLSYPCAADWVMVQPIRTRLEKVGENMRIGRYITWIIITLGGIGQSQAEVAKAFAKSTARAEVAPTCAERR